MDEKGILILLLPYAKLAINASVDRAIAIMIDSKIVNNRWFMS